ncbi:MAG: hypothetical protein KME54_28220 [Tolypothrix brevis GSE-NOS-MK-07-07A]|jgi:hypothetical protein|nr:hypothetical protein [Tolypothrix brevis GSE-NOS-MK-07-07A]
MLRRSLFACALMLAGVVGFASSAKAVSEPVTLSGTIPTACIIDSVVPGTLVASGDNKTLSSTLSGGAAATLNINCTTGTVSLTPPTKTGGDPGTTLDGDIETKTAKLTLSDTTSVDSGATAIPVAAGAATVNLVATDTSAVLIPGAYTFSTTVTVTP